MAAPYRFAHCGGFLRLLYIKILNFILESYLLFKCNSANIDVCIKSPINITQIYTSFVLNVFNICI